MVIAVDRHPPIQASGDGLGTECHSAAAHPRGPEERAGVFESRNALTGVTVR